MSVMDVSFLTKKDRLNIYKQKKVCICCGKPHLDRRTSCLITLDYSKSKNVPWLVKSTFIFCKETCSKQFKKSCNINYTKRVLTTSFNIITKIQQKNNK